MRKRLFPYNYFPTTWSIVTYLATITCLMILVSTTFILPEICKVNGKDFIQPKALNSLALAGFLGSMMFYAVERTFNKKGKGN